MQNTSFREALRDAATSNFPLYVTSVRSLPKGERKNFHKKTILVLSFDWKAPKPAAPDRHTALKKATNYCGHQKRSHKDLRNKLYDLGVWTNDVEEIITEMILKGSLSEEHFALHYVVEKFKTNQWGKIKIRHGLRAKNIPDKMIERVLNRIDPDTYVKTIARGGKFDVLNSPLQTNN